jgi:hypothetical protein
LASPYSSKSFRNDCFSSSTPRSTQRKSISQLSNVVAKMLLVVGQHLPFACRAARVRRDMCRCRCERVSCEPGNVYAFNGFVTPHANLDVERGERRSLIVHYYDPCLSAGLRAFTQTLRAVRDRIADAL